MYRPVDHALTAGHDAPAKAPAGAASRHVAPGRQVAVGRAADGYEREAGRVAAEVVRRLTRQGAQQAAPVPVPVPASDTADQSAVVRRKWTGEPVPEPEDDEEEMLGLVRTKYAELVEENADVEGASVFWNDATHSLLVHFPSDEEAGLEASGTEYTYKNDFWSDAEIEGDRLVDIFEEATSVAAADTRLGGELTTLGIDDKSLKPLFGKESEEELRWLTGLPAAAVEIAVQLCTQRGVALADLRSLLAYNTNTQAYPADVVLGWVRTHTLASTRIALEATASENRRLWVDSFLACEGVNNASAAHRHLIRIRAYLLGGANTMFVFKQDKKYNGDPGGRSRTGFLRFTFAAGPFAEIHTHWNQDVHKLVSMHVQDGANGCEINQWLQFFRPVADAVVAAHNAAGGVLAPTGGNVAL